ncbi:MAG: NAD-dependent epimerase/dehydratase family protein [Chitinophagales bacterium]|nr:NAD-dependent epimerase/dehydratase family protein [Chitinophagaceae bacterium]MCB9064660.1 NAD-dependent epimerase/dehydratase family protein [Chitinophagales bacterium]
MRVLISGSTGFIGQNLIPYLQKHVTDLEVFVLVRQKKGLENEILWDELDTTTIENLTAVIHLAGLAHDTKNSLNDDAYFHVNYELTKQLYDWSVKNNATKFIYTSSVKAVADSVECVLEEEDNAAPVTAYGISKLKAEQYIQQSSTNSLTYYILRPCMVHGPGNKGNLNLLYKFVKKGLPYPLGAFDNNRSFLAIENFCYVVNELITRDIESGVYNLADDKAISTKELFSIISQVIGQKAKVWNIPKGVVATAASIGGLFKLPLNTERLDKLTENYVVSNKKIKQALHIDKLPVAVEDGITKTIFSFES